MQLALSHVGFRPESPRIVTFCPGPNSDSLPDVIPFYLRQNCLRMRRERIEEPGFSERFPCPYDLLHGKLLPDPGKFYYRGELRRIDTRWGRFWQSNFSDFSELGSYQIEIDQQISPPFMISSAIYDRMVRGFLTFLGAQRCGCEVPGVHPACHLDDGILDSDGSYWPAAGGWHDAGDARKWLALTQGNLESLAHIVERGHPAFRTVARDEMRWGNILFHRMITDEGQVFEDVAGGSAPEGAVFTYEDHWWFENHPGCYGDATDNRWTDNIFHSGDERMVRTTYNPLVQFSFVQMQMLCARALPGAEGALCRALAERAWAYGVRRGQAGRTLFVAQQLLAVLEIHQTCDHTETIQTLVQVLLERQEVGDSLISGFFYEKDRMDAYRSIAYAGHPAWALLRLIELAPNGLDIELERCREAVTRYCDRYLAADALSNPFGLTPYGVFLHREHEERQVYRDAGGGRFIRTFMHPFNQQGIVHGTSSVLLSHAAVLAKAGALMGRSDWQALAERQLQWTFGHNTLNRSLFTGIGYRQPIAYGFRTTQIPEASVIGFIGRPDDTPYLEESFAIEWNTSEIWDVPYAHGVNAICWLK